MNLDRYIQGIRKGREINRIEREAMDDPFLSDALDGYNKVNNLYADQIREMQEKISLRTRQKSQTFRYWGVAASILVVIGFGGYFLFDGHFLRKKPLPFEKNVQPMTEIAAVEKTDSTIVQADSLPAVETIAFTPPVIVKDEVVSADMADMQSHTIHVADIIQAEAVNIAIETPIPVDTIKDVLIAMKESESELSEIVTNAFDKKMEQEKASVMPEPVIGKKAYKNYLKKSLVRPIDEECGKAKGKVELSFYIDESGRPTKINIKKSLCQSANAEAIRLVKEGPEWTKGDKEITIEVKF
jgi:hypothetical protein